MIIKSKWLIGLVSKIMGIRAAAVALFPFIIISPDVEVTPELINHERIHLRQQGELLIIPFFIWYFIEFKRKGYYSVSFEKEAYDNENNLTYLKKRRMFAFRRYL
jgi:hypothetical protein